VPRGNYKFLVAQLRFNAEGRAADVKQQLDESPDLAAAGLKRKLVTSDADSVTITIPRFFGFPRPEVVAARVRAVLDVLKRAVPDNRKVCRECGMAGAEPAILRGKVDRVCGGCAERLEQEGREAQNAYASRPLNLPLGLVASLVAGAAGAVVYDTVFSLVGGVIGALTAIKKAKPPDFTVVQKAPDAGFQG
jgi:hypothetical protein